MRAENFLISTLRESPGDAVVASHKLMIRAGLVRKLGSGLYHLLPLGLRVFRKIENVIREEMDAAGGLEFQLPILTPAELWEKSGRWDAMGKEMFRIKDRHEDWNVLGPTHEENFAFLLKDLVQSYRDLPLNVYQIHTKFRDEVRPRYGVIRSREFCMKDAYSFDRDQAGLDATYEKMRVTYRRIFARLGLKTIPVEADSGAMGGSGSEEFMIESEIGEETLLLSEGEKYRGNQEKTVALYEGATSARKEKTEPAKLEEVHTPGMKTIEDVANFLNTTPREIMKTVLYIAGAGESEQAVAVCIRGDRQVNEVKVKNALRGAELRPAEPPEIVKLGSIPGFIGPFELARKGEDGGRDPAAKDVIILWDSSLEYGQDWVIGANKKGYHLKGFNPGPDIETRDLALAVNGDPSPEGDGKLREVKGIEVGHIFKLGYKYSDAFELTFLDEKGKAQKPIMGSYGIGVNRAIAAIVEQYHDEQGVAWPIAAAPFEVCLVGIAREDSEIAQVEEIYKGLLAAGLEVIWDDRDERPGVKFKDTELIGYPIRVTIGKTFFKEGAAEIFIRSTQEKSLLKGNITEIVAGVKGLRDKLDQELKSSLGI